MRRALLTVVCGCLLFTLRPAPAGATPATSKHALELAYEADDLYARGKWNEAYERFSEADGLAHSPVFVLYMARCRKNSGRLLEAEPIYSRVAGETLASDAPKPFRTAVSDATTELAELKTHTPHARIEVKNPPKKNVDVFVDDKAVSKAASIALDPGVHVFTAKSGDAVAKESVELSQSATEKLVQLDFGSGSKAKEKPALAKRGSLVPGAVVMSVAAASLVVGAVTGGVAIAETNDIKKGCIGNHCLSSDRGAIDRARLLANVSTATLIIGGAAVVTGTVLLAVRPGGSSGPTVTAAPGFLAVHGSF